MNKYVLTGWLLFLNISTGNAQINIDTASFNAVFSDLDLAGENIVVFAEAHTVQNTLGTEFYVIQKLAAKGYKTIYIEGGRSEAAIINSFLQTGDTSKLEYTRAAEETGSYRKFLLSIYQANRENQYGLVFKGFDFERPACVGYLFSKWFGNDKISNIDFKKTSDYLLSLDEKNSKDLNDVGKNSLKLKVIIDSIKTSFEEYEDQYKEILKDNFPIFKEIVFNPVYADFRKKGDYFTSRDTYAANSMLQVDKDGTLNRSILIVGSDHVVYKNRFIPLLADSLPGKYTIIDFIFIYSNCEDYEVNKKYSSPKELLKYLDKRGGTTPLIRFTWPEQLVVPTSRKNMLTVIAGMYNQ